MVCSGFKLQLSNPGSFLRSTAQVAYRHFIKSRYINVFLDVEKEYRTKKGDTGKALRYVTSQPLKRGETYNMRKLEELPWQLVKAGMFNVFQQEIVLNLDWHLAKMNAFSFW